MVKELVTKIINFLEQNPIANPDIPKTTNGLESFFGHLKQNISLHRGLSKEHYNRSSLDEETVKSYIEAFNKNYAKRQ
jgi:hypothetical protein